MLNYFKWGHFITGTIPRSPSSKPVWVPCFVWHSPENSERAETGHSHPLPPSHGTQPMRASGRQAHRGPLTQGSFQLLSYDTQLTCSGAKWSFPPGFWRVVGSAEWPPPRAQCGKVGSRESQQTQPQLGSHGLHQKCEASLSMWYDKRGTRLVWSFFLKLRP
jgi:hypothetical protein